MVKRDYCFGIYKYTDKETGHIVYIGKDSHIDKNLRHIEHFQPCKYDNQPINRILQNNPDRYEYSVWYHVSNIKELNQLEFDLINLYRPKFNFQHGGNGKSLNKTFEYTVAKGGVSRFGKQRYIISDINHNNLISSIDSKYLKALCVKLNKKELTPSQIKQMNKPKIISKESRLKISNSSNSTGFYCVYKKKDNTCKQGFIWTYQYYDKKYKRKSIKRVDLFDLKEAVENKGLTWKCNDTVKATNTVKSLYNIP